MAVLFFIMLILSIVVFFIGILDPKLVILWGPSEQRTRCNAILTYSLVIFVFLILFGVSAAMTQPSPEQQAVNAQIAEQKAAEKAQQEESKAKEEEIKNFQRAVIEKRDTAVKVAQKLIQDRLLSPSTAKFAPLSNSTANSKLYLKGNDTYEIVSYVDTKNGYGVVIRIPFKITVKYNSEDKKWEELEYELYTNL